MSMAEQIIQKPESCPLCSRCGTLTRIYGIEPHAGTPRTDVLTYVCDACETTEVRISAAPAGMVQ